MARLTADLGPPGHWRGDGCCVEFGADGKPAPHGQVEQCGTDQEKHKALEDESIFALSEKPNKLYQVMVGDTGSYSSYYVHNEEPLVLSHVPCSYHAPIPHIRGLLMSDITQELDWPSRLAELYSTQGEADPPPEPEPSQE